MRALTVAGVGLLLAVGLHVNAWDDAALRSPRFAIAEEPSATLPYFQGVTNPAAATEVATRGTAVQVTPTLPPPTVPVGLLGLPYAPDGLDDCAEFAFYRSQWGLPSRFDGIAWRESNCLNRDDVRTSCCVGWLQLWVDLHLRDHRLAPLYAACGVASYRDVNSDTPEDKQRHLCAAAALYSVEGTDPWVATR